MFEVIFGNMKKYLTDSMDGQSDKGPTVKRRSEKGLGGSVSFSYCDASGLAMIGSIEAKKTTCPEVPSAV